MSTIRWNVAVSADTDQSLRMFLASQGSQCVNVSEAALVSINFFALNRT